MFCLHTSTYSCGGKEAGTAATDSFFTEVRISRKSAVDGTASVKADSHIACLSPAMPFVNSHIQCRAPALLHQCRVLRECPHGSRKYPTASPTV